MLLTMKQMKHLEPIGDYRFRFVENGKVTDNERQELLDLDASYFEVYQFHIITNLEELKK